MSYEGDQPVDMLGCVFVGLLVLALVFVLGIWVGGGFTR